MRSTILGLAATLSLLLGLFSSAGAEGHERRETIVRQIGEPAIGPRGDEVVICIGVAALPGEMVPYRTAVAGMVTLEQKTGAGWVRIGSAHASGCHGGRDPYALARVTMIVPAAVSPGDRIEMRFNFAGNSAYLPATCSGYLLVH